MKTQEECRTRCAFLIMTNTVQISQGQRSDNTFLFVHFQKIFLENNREDMFANRADDMRNCASVAVVVASKAVRDGS